MASPNTVTMQNMLLFSHRIVQLPVRMVESGKKLKSIVQYGVESYHHSHSRHLPSVELSQKHEQAECSPAPFFCIITQFTGGKE